MQPNWADIFFISRDQLYWKEPGPRRTMDKPAGYLHSRGYFHFEYKDRTYKVHNVIWQIRNGPIPKGMIVDHINSNKQDNSVGNLRLATETENNRNKTKMATRPCHSVYKGLDKVGRKWRARIRFEGAILNLGVYFTENEAALAYNEGAKKYYGAFAKLNEIVDV